MDDYYISRITGNQILLLNNAKKYFYQYIINEDFTITLQREINLNTSGKLKGKNFRANSEATRFILKDSLLFINYSVNKPKNYIDSRAIVYFNLNNPVPEFIIGYPDSYYKEQVYLSGLIFDVINDSCLAYSYVQNDATGIFNIKNNTIIQSRIKHNCGFLRFDEDKYMNLGYVNNYLLKNENNFKLFADNSAHIYLLKRLAKVNKTDSTAMECYVFDTKLNPIHYFKLNQTVCPSYIYKYQQGFLAFNDSLSKAWYYAFE